MDEFNELQIRYEQLKEELYKLDLRQVHIYHELQSIQDKMSKLLHEKIKI